MILIGEAIRGCLVLRISISISGLGFACTSSNESQLLNGFIRTRVLTFSILANWSKDLLNLRLNPTKPFTF